jgi:multicomponent Na+:H+ antiporter subunit D
MLPFPVDYQPYTAYHISETLQILGFTGLGFYLMVKYLHTEPKSNLDVDWFYRKGALAFMWVACKPISIANDWVGEVYRTVGLRFTMLVAKALSWFDWEGIDWAVDNSAKGVVEGGDKMRTLQTGKIQQYIGGAVAALMIVLLVVVFL